MIILRSLLITCMLFLVGCNKNFSYTYLLQHPKVLQSEVKLCQQSQNQAINASKHCELVMYAAASFMALINELQESPEKFGQKILTAQYDLSESRLKWQQAQDALQQLKLQQSIDTKTLQIAEKKLAFLKNTYDNQQEKVNTLLAVAGLEAPE